MVRGIPIDLVFYDSEPEIAVAGGPLFLGYREHIAGRPEVGRKIVATFLACVYAAPSRLEETSTERYVREIYRERLRALPADKPGADPAIVFDAACRRYDRLHRPLLESILKDGYEPSLGEPITMTARGGRYLVGDGKNRCSILAVLGRAVVPNVEVT